MISIDKVRLGYQLGREDRLAGDEPAIVELNGVLCECLTEPPTAITEDDLAFAGAYVVGYGPFYVPKWE